LVPGTPAQFEFGPYGADMYAPGALPRLSLVARVKPADAHNKAGNINNVLSNSNADGKIVLFLDADMKPVESYLLRVLPLLLEEQRTDSLQSQLVQAEDPELGTGQSKSWQINRDVGFVGCPQRFANVAGDHPDYCAVRLALRVLLALQSYIDSLPCSSRGRAVPVSSCFSSRVLTFLVSSPASVSLSPLARVLCTSGLRSIATLCTTMAFARVATALA